MPAGLKNIKKQILRSSRNYLIRSNRYSFLYSVNCRVYKLLEYLINRYYSTLPQITSIYLAHGLALDEVFPGLSDFDLAIIYKSTANQDEFYSKLRKRWKMIQGFISARDLLLFTDQEFNHWQSYGGGWEPLDELAHWKLLYGKELRKNTFRFNNYQAEKDRTLYSLSKYFSLLKTVLKEEPNSPFLGTTVRRNIYKNFCNSVLPLENKYLALGNQFGRLTKWIEDNADNSQALYDLLKIRINRFQKGNISKLRFSAGVHAYIYIDKTLAKSTLYYNFPFDNNSGSREIIPVYNRQEVENKIKGFASSISDMLKDKLKSIMVVSNGSPVGFMFFVIPKDDLEFEEIEEMFRTIHVIFRIYDDSWFNEHFPFNVPIIYSKNMFLTHMKLWPYHRINARFHRSLLFGEDIFHLIDEPALGNALNNKDDIILEKTNLSRSLHLIILERNKPALYDLITLQFPRYFVLEKTGFLTATVNESISYYSQLNVHDSSNLPIYFHEKYGSKSIHDLSTAITENEFNEAINFLCNSLYSLA